MIESSAMKQRKREEEGAERKREREQEITQQTKVKLELSVTMPARCRPCWLHLTLGGAPLCAQVGARRQVSCELSSASLWPQLSPRSGVGLHSPVGTRSAHRATCIDRRLQSQRDRLLIWRDNQASAGCS